MKSEAEDGDDFHTRGGAGLAFEVEPLLLHYT